MRDQRGGSDPRGRPRIDESINVMQIQIKARQDGGYLPFADTLPSAIGED